MSVIRPRNSPGYVQHWHILHDEQEYVHTIIGDRCAKDRLDRTDKHWPPNYFNTIICAKELKKAPDIYTCTCLLFPPEGVFPQRCLKKAISRRITAALWLECQTLGVLFHEKLFIFLKSTNTNM